MELRATQIGGPNKHCSVPTEVAASQHKSVEFHGLLKAAGNVLNVLDSILTRFDKLHYSISVTVFRISYNLRSSI